jgi:hypothetical protein
MLLSILDAVMGCSHRRTSFPMTMPREANAAQRSDVTRNGAYVVCLDCGKEFAYNWQEMRIDRSAKPPAPLPATALGRHVA